MYRIAVCDDEPLMAEQNAAMTRRILDGRGLTAEQDYHIDAFTSPEPLMEQLAAQLKAYDLLLLDIELAGENGVKLASLLREKRFTASIIYITGHAGFAMDSFPTRPLDYLLKPVDEKRLAAALDWDLQKMEQRTERPMLRSGTRAILLSSIRYLEIHGRSPWPIWTREMKRSRSLFPSWRRPCWSGASAAAITAIWSIWIISRRSGAHRCCWTLARPFRSAGAAIRS